MLLSLFAISFIAGALIVVLSAASVVTGKFQFWPPPRKASWQYQVFWWLFRGMFVGLFLISILNYQGLGELPLVLSAIGAVVFVLGFGIAIHVTLYLGWSNTRGNPDGFKMGGWYQRSRNPVYVASLVGMAGLGLFVNSSYAYALLILWASMYLVAPFLEEPWLEEKYGRKYLQYKAKVPRFIGPTTFKPRAREIK